LDAKKAGSLIGKGGAVINSLRETSGAWVDISSSTPGTVKRILTVKGDLRTVSAAFHRICLRLMESRQMDDFTPDSDDKNQDIAITFLVGDSQVGAIIGRSGTKINQTRSETGASIKVSDEVLPLSTEKTILVRGMSQSVIDAVQTIVSQLHEVVDRPPRLPYCPNVESASSAAFNANALLYAQQFSNPYAQLTNRQANIPNVQLATQGQQGTYFTPTDPYSQAVAMSLAQQSMGSMPQTNSSTQSFMFPIPESLVGGVIGKKGSVISEIRQRSGATIKIPNADPGGVERLLHITGTPEANQIAIGMIQQKMANSGPHSSSS
jgi:polyribonucleotide nucleotidyltransferase